MFALLAVVAVAQVPPPAPEPSSYPPMLVRFSVTGGKVFQTVYQMVPVVTKQAMSVTEMVDGRPTTVTKTVDVTTMQTQQVVQPLPDGATFATAGGAKLSAAQATAALDKQPVGALVVGGPPDRAFLAVLKPDTVVVTLPVPKMERMPAMPGAAPPAVMPTPDKAPAPAAPRKI